MSLSAAVYSARLAITAFELGDEALARYRLNEAHRLLPAGEPKITTAMTQCGKYTGVLDTPDLL